MRIAGFGLHVRKMSGKSEKCQENQGNVRKIQKRAGKSGKCQENQEIVRKIRKLSEKNSTQENQEIVRKKFDSGKSGNCQEKIRFRKIRKFVRKSQSEPCRHTTKYILKVMEW